MAFLKKHWLDISLALLGIFFIITYIIVFNIQIDPPQHLKKGRLIVLEPLSNRFNKLLRKGFCRANKKPHNLDKNCRKLSKKSCNATSCCVHAHRSDKGQSTCVAGDSLNGPIYKGDSKGELYPYDYWYSLGKKYPFTKNR